MISIACGCEVQNEHFRLFQYAVHRLTEEWMLLLATWNGQIFSQLTSWIFLLAQGKSYVCKMKKSSTVLVQAPVIKNCFISVDSVCWFWYIEDSRYTGHDFFTAYIKAYYTDIALCHQTSTWRATSYASRVRVANKSGHVNKQPYFPARKIHRDFLQYYCNQH